MFRRKCNTTFHKDSVPVEVDRVFFLSRLLKLEVASDVDGAFKDQCRWITGVIGRQVPIPVRKSGSLRVSHVYGGARVRSSFHVLQIVGGKLSSGPGQVNASGIAYGAIDDSLAIEALLMW